MHLNRLFFILSFLLFMPFVAGLYAAEADSLVRFSDLDFSSDFQERVFTDLALGKEVDMIDTYLSIEVRSENEAGRYRAQFEAFMKKLGYKDLAEMKDKKKVKTIYTTVHSELMKLYEEDAYFPELWRDGTFNCVTGTVIYSMIFDAYGIPYLVHKGMNHVFLVAYPETHTIIIESTDSEDGYKVVGSKAKKGYVDQLSQGKMITSDELSSQGVSNVFLKFAYKKNEIDAMGLASVQYYNRGISCMREKNHSEAYGMFQKAYYLSPDEELEPLLMITGGMALHMSEYKSLRDVHLVYQLARFAESGITNDDIVAEFARLTKKIYVDRKEEGKYGKAYKILMESLDDEDLKEEISKLYYGTLVPQLYAEGRKKETTDVLYQLYLLDPDDQEVQILLYENIVEELREYHEQDPVAALDMLYGKRDSLPGIFDMPDMLILETSLILTSGGIKFSRGQPEVGESYIQKFENDFLPRVNHSQLNHLEGAIQGCYEEAAFYYYGKGNARKTREYLDRGLKIIPDNPRLRYMRSSI